MDIVDAGIQANEAINMLDGTHRGLMNVHAKIRDFIFAAYNLGNIDSKELIKLKDFREKAFMAFPNIDIDIERLS